MNRAPGSAADGSRAVQQAGLFKAVMRAQVGHPNTRASDWSYRNLVTQAIAAGGTGWLFATPLVHTPHAKPIVSMLAAGETACGLE